MLQDVEESLWRLVLLFELYDGVPEDAAVVQKLKVACDEPSSSSTEPKPLRKFWCSAAVFLS